DLVTHSGDVDGVGPAVANRHLTVLEGRPEEPEIEGSGHLPQVVQSATKETTKEIFHLRVVDDRATVLIDDDGGVQRPHVGHVRNLAVLDRLTVDGAGHGEIGEVATDVDLKGPRL